MSDPLKPSPTLLMKLGSAVVHADEMAGPDGHVHDADALHSALLDPELQAWISEMTALALLPVRRKS